MTLGSIGCPSDSEPEPDPGAGEPAADAGNVPSAGDAGVPPTGAMPGAAVIEGFVVDRDRQPLEGVTVTALGRTGSTDRTGRFVLSGLELTGNRMVVYLHKAGYFDLTVGAVRASMGPTHLHALMQPKVRLGPVDNGVGGTLEGDGLTVEVPPRAFRGAGGALIEGRVEIFAARVNPDDSSFGLAMPGGDFAATSSSGRAGVLISGGALTIEAETESGEPATINESFTLSLPLPVSVDPADLASMRLWFLGNNGVWELVEVPVEVRGNRFYFAAPTLGVLNVDRFAFPTRITGQVCDGSGSPVAGTEVRAGQMVAVTDMQGQYTLDAPEGRFIELTSEYGSTWVEPGREGERTDLGNCGTACQIRPGSSYSGQLGYSLERRYGWTEERSVVEGNVSFVQTFDGRGLPGTTLLERLARDLPEVRLLGMPRARLEGAAFSLDYEGWEAGTSVRASIAGTLDCTTDILAGTVSLSAITTETSTVETWGVDLFGRFTLVDLPSGADAGVGDAGSSDGGTW